MAMMGYSGEGVMPTRLGILQTGGPYDVGIQRSLQVGKTNEKYARVPFVSKKLVLLDMHMRQPRSHWLISHHYTHFAHSGHHDTPGYASFSSTFQKNWHHICNGMPPLGFIPIACTALSLVEQLKVGRSACYLVMILQIDNWN